MKKLISLALAVVLALSLVACGASVSLDKSEHTFTAAGETLQLTADSKKAVTFTSSDTAVATVDANGLVTAVAPGTATITAAVDEKTTATCTIKCEWVETVDLMAFYTALCDQYGENFPANASVTEMPEMLDMFFPGLSAIETNQMIIFQPMMGAVVCEIALIEVVNSADVAAVTTILEERINAQVNGGAWYPESIEGWQNNSRVVANGNYIMMIAYSECDAVVNSFNALF